MQPVTSVEVQMGDRRGDALPDRVGAVCGIAFTALAVTSVVVVPPPPESDVAVATVRDYLLSHQGGLSISTAVMGFAAMVVIGFFGLASRRVGEKAGDGGVARSAFVVAATVVVSMTMLGVVLQAALVQQIAPAADDSTLSALYAVWDRVFHTAPAMGMAVVLISAVAGRRQSRTYPAWLTVTALLAAVLTVIDVAEDLSSTGSNLGPLGLIAFALSNVWIVATSVRVLTERHSR